MWKILKVYFRLIIQSKRFEAYSRECNLDVLCSRYLRCSKNTNARNCFASESLYGNALTCSYHKATFLPLMASCQILNSQCEFFSWRFRSRSTGLQFAIHWSVEFVFGRKVSIRFTVLTWLCQTQEPFAIGYQLTAIVNTTFAHVLSNRRRDQAHKVLQTSKLYFCAADCVSVSCRICV